MLRTCTRCGLKVNGEHLTAEDCVRHLAPRYQLAQNAIEAMHRRYRSLEERMERSKIQERIARKDAAAAKTVAGRLDRLERLMGVAS